MGQILTANVATNLYWLGRYLERTEATLIAMLKAYDKIIDVDKEAGIKLYKTFNVDLEYTDALDFLHVAILGDHSANLLSMMTQARENAIICRHRLDTEAFGEIIELHGLFKSVSTNTFDLDYKVIDRAQSLISEIWGTLSKREHRKHSDYFFRLGKLVEEADLRVRFKKDEEITMHVIDDIDAIIDLLNHDDEPIQKQSQSQSSSDDLLTQINTKINKIIVE
jgi:uncharacterized alpha-E superfamily protein